MRQLSRLLDSHDLPLETKRALRKRLEHTAVDEGYRQLQELPPQDEPDHQNSLFIPEVCSIGLFVALGISISQFRMYASFDQSIV